MNTIEVPQYNRDKAHIASLLLLFISIICLPSSICAQQFSAEWNVGINTGVNLSDVDFMPRIKTKGMTTGTIGISVRYISEKNLGLLGELNYSRQGFTQDFSDADLPYTYSRDINYLELPLLSHIYFGNKTRFFVNIGPKIAFQISSKETMNGELITLIENNQQNTLSVYEHLGAEIDKKIDYGLLAGLGIECRSKIGLFSLEGRYYLGLGDIFNNSRSDVFSRSAHRVLSIKINYFIPHSKK